jgi:hypothetical protein
VAPLGTPTLHAPQFVEVRLSLRLSGVLLTQHVAEVTRYQRQRRQRLPVAAQRAERTDLGPGAATLVRAGDPVPNWLASLPRKPVDGKPGKLKGGRR